MRDEWDIVFARRGPFSQLTEARQALLAQARPVAFSRGDPIVCIGDAPGGIFGLLTGGVACEITGTAHGPVIGHILRAGTWFGEGPALTGERRIMTFFASEDSQLVHVPLAALRTLTAENAEVARGMAQLGERAARLAIDALCDLMIPEGERRLAAVLLRVTAARDGVEPLHPGGWRLNQAELADMANLSRGYAGGMLTAWERAGLIRLGHGRMCVENAGALQSIAEGR